MIVRLLLAAALLTGCGGIAAAQDQLQLFLLIGQSNMAGRGPMGPADREPIPGVLALDREMKWIPAVDPLHWDKPAIAGVGPGRTFAKELLQLNPAMKIGLIPAAFGGTSLDEWKPAGKLYENAVRRTREAMKSGKLRGILWHQGEADSRSEALAKSYDERFAAMIRQFRADLGAADVPVVVGELGEFFQAPFAAVVNQQLALAPLSVLHCAFVSSAGLTPKSDHVHFDTPSQHEFGRRYALAFAGLDPVWAPLR
jgi:hypothetical protein